MKMVQFHMILLVNSVVPMFFLKRAPEGTGIIAGGPARATLELAGIRNIRTKSLGSNNKQNVVLAVLDGLAALKTPEEIAKKSW